MRTATYIIGLIVTILIFLGSLLKFMHWPGSSLLLILCLSGFLPLYMVFVMIIVGKQRKTLAPLIVSGSFLLIYLIGILFLIMRWPGGNVSALFGGLGATISLLVVAISNMRWKSENQKFSPNTLFLIVIGLWLCLAATTRNPAPAQTGALIANENEIRTREITESINQRLYQRLDSTQRSRALSFKEDVNAYVDLIEEVKQKIGSACNDGRPFDSYNTLEAPQNIDFGGYITESYFPQMHQYQEKLLASMKQVTDENTYTYIAGLFMPANFEFSQQDPGLRPYYHVPAISVIAILSALQTKARLCEQLALNSLTQKL